MTSTIKRVSVFVWFLVLVISLSVRAAPHLQQIELGNYHVEGLPVHLSLKNASGLTWHSGRKTLWLVTNKPAAIYELSTDGQILQSFPLNNVTDPEGICWLGGSRFAIVEECAARLRVFVLSKGNRLLEDTAYKFQVDRPDAMIVYKHKKPKTCGLEGLTYDFDRSILWIAKEKKPIKMYRVKCALNTLPSLLSSPWANLPWRVKDISGLFWCDSTHRLWVLSDKSATVVEIDNKGNVVDNLSLFLQGKWIDDAEGITLDDMGNLYICCEPNLLYRFRQ